MKQNENQKQLTPDTLLKKRYLIKKMITKGESTQTYLAYDKVNNN